MEKNTGKTKSLEKVYIFPIKTQSAVAKKRTIARAPALRTEDLHGDAAGRRGGGDPGARDGCGSPLPLRRDVQAMRPSRRRAVFPLPPLAGGREPPVLPARLLLRATTP